MKKINYKVLLLSTIAIFFISCRNSNSNYIDENQNSRIFKVIENTENSSNITNYEYNEQNLLIKKTVTLDSGIVQDIEEFLYNENNQIVSQIKVGSINFYNSSTYYKYGNLIYNKNNLPVVVSSDSNFSFAGTISNTHIDYTYNLNEQQRATGIDYTITYYQSLGMGIDILQDEEVINYDYDENGRVISKDNISYTYNEFGKLAYEFNSNYQIVYSYNEKNLIVTATRYNDGVVVDTKNYFYENGLYDSSAFSITYFDQGQYISSGIY